MGGRHEVGKLSLRMSLGGMMVPYDADIGLLVEAILAGVVLEARLP